MYTKMLAERSVFPLPRSTKLARIFAQQPSWETSSLERDKTPARTHRTRRVSQRFFRITRALLTHRELYGTTYYFIHWIINPRERSGCVASESIARRLRLPLGAGEASGQLLMNVGAVLVLGENTGNVLFAWRWHRWRAVAGRFHYAADEHSRTGPGERPANQRN